MNKTVALFDLDGVVFDTEPLYTAFWKRIFNIYYPDREGLEQEIKGQALTEIYATYFSHMEKEQQEITQALKEYEAQMPFIFVKGFKEFVLDLRANGMKTAVVTSSNQEKMCQVYYRHPDFSQLFDKILTSEDFTRSKPAPDPYLIGASCLHASPAECIGFEDSFNGLKSVKTAQMTVVGLTTSNPHDAIVPYCDCVIPDYVGLSYVRLMNLLATQV